MDHVPPDVKDLLTQPAELFKDAPAGLGQFASVNRSDRREYAELVVNKLVSRKVDLSRVVSAGASIFPVGKKDSTKVRKVWDGLPL